MTAERVPLPPATVELLLLITARHHAGLPITYGPLVAATGWHRHKLYLHIHRLLAAGLLEQEKGRRGTLRPTVRIAAASPRRHHASK